MIAEEKIYAVLTSVFSDVFLRDDIPLSAGLSAADVEGWDSFKQIEIVMAVEEYFRVKFTSAELDNMQNLGDIVRVIAERGRAPDRL